MAEGDPLLLRVGELLSHMPDAATSRPTKLQGVMQAFIDANEDAQNSQNLRSQAADPVEPLVGLLGSPAVRASDELLVRTLKMLKIVSRKFENRATLGPLVVPDLIRVLQQKPSSPVAAEAANVVLNMCYESGNVGRVIKGGGVPPLIGFLSRDAEDVQANAAGAIQSICFQKEGREFMREQEVIPAVLPLLSSSNLKVQTRAVGAVHNISSEPEAIRIIRRLKGVEPLVKLLRAPSAAVCGSAAGALQNLSRESIARDQIHQLGAVIPLTDLLFGEDVQSQVCAAGAILNVIGPMLGSEDQQDNRDRMALKKLLSLALTVGMLHTSMRDVQALLKLASRRTPEPS